MAGTKNMNFKLAVILVIFGISGLEASKSYGGDGDDIIEENSTDIYYKRSRVAAEGICDQNLCLTKCCPFGSEYDVNNKTCKNTTQMFNAPVYDDYFTQISNSTDTFFFQHGIIECENNYVRNYASLYPNLNGINFFLKQDGNLHIDSLNGCKAHLTITPDKYCVDNFVSETDGVKTTKLDALICSIREEDPNNYILNATCMLISCVFILITVVVYIWLPKLHNIHGRVLVAYLTCLFVGFLVSAIMQLQLYYEQEVYCKTITFIMYFSLLAAFFWLNVMCFDIWRVFSGKREVRPQKMLVWSQLRAYALYAFGVPTILTIVLGGLEGSGLRTAWWMPNMGIQGCFLSNCSKLIYLYAPMLILCMANTVLFILTTVRIAKTRKETSVLSSRESSRHDQQNDTQTLFLYVKLFILMGINWALEVASDWYPSKIWVYTDCYNVLIGFIIFIIFVCKRQIFNLLKERYRQVRNYPASQNHTSWSRTTTTYK